MRRAKKRSKVRPADPPRRTTRFTNARLNMFRRVHRVESILQFLRERAPHYGPLARDDLHKFRDEIVNASVGAKGHFGCAAISAYGSCACSRLYEPSRGGGSTRAVGIASAASTALKCG